MHPGDPEYELCRRRDDSDSNEQKQGDRKKQTLTHSQED
jgi:hypothetical protein